MAEPEKTLKEKVGDLIGFGTKINETVTKGVDIPLRDMSLNLRSPNWEDLSAKLSIPSKDWRKPGIAFTFTLDLEWHQPIKDFGARKLDEIIQSFKK